MAVAGLLASAGASAPALALVPISGTLGTTVQVFRLDTPDIQTKNVALDWQDTPARLSYRERLTTNPFGAPKRGTVSAEALAEWTPGGRGGRVVFNWQWVFYSEVGTGDVGGSFVQQGPDWTYSFTADRDGVFVWEGQIAPLRGQGPPELGNNLFGLSGWDLSLNGETVIPLIDPTGGTTRTGDRDFRLVGGETYTFALNSFSNITGSNFPDGYYGGVEGQFGFQFFPDAVTAPIPEPGSWTLLILGFGLVGARLRVQSPRRAAA